MDDVKVFLKGKGFDEKTIEASFRKCKALQGTDSKRASENWDYLKSIGIPERKLPYVVTKCPKILALNLEEKLVPTVQCLSTLSSKTGTDGNVGTDSTVSLASAIVKFPNILSHSVEEKLCPLLAFLQSLGVSEKQLGKLLLFNPRLISYSIETKFSRVVDFLASLGFEKEGQIGKIITKDPFIVGYNVEKRLKPTTEFLKSIGLNETQLKKVVLNFPEVLSRDVDKILAPNLAFIKKCGFSNGQIVELVSGYPLILIKSVKNSLEPKIRFLVEKMGRNVSELAEYPEFFKHGLKKSLERREKVLRERNVVSCSLSEMLGCNERKFMAKYGLVA